MTRVPQPPSLESKSPSFGINDPKSSKFEHGQIGVVNLKTSFFGDEFPEIMVKK
jgi:hypothetical protein